MLPLSPRLELHQLMTFLLGCSVIALMPVAQGGGDCCPFQTKYKLFSFTEALNFARYHREEAAHPVTFT